jgi:6-phosphogluconolactonase
VIQVQERENNQMSNQKYFVYIGTYARSEENGIYVCSFDVESGELTLERSYAGIENPSFLALNSQKQRLYAGLRHYLYAVGETETFLGEKGGSVAAFAIQPETGELTRLNSQPTCGGSPCYVSLDRTGNCLLVANYSGGNINLFPLQANGEIGPMAENIQHAGHGSNPQRQEGPHPHSILVDPSGQYAFVPDLGLDTLFAYQLDASVPSLSLHRETREQDGAGPRHLAFHPSGRYAYLINELNSTITAFTYDVEQGEMRALQTVPTLPEDFTGENTCADIHVSPSGKHLYGSNRGHDSIAVFRIDLESGTLTFVQHVSTGGKTPRNFALAPDGRFLFAANQDSDSIVSYAVEPETGRLSPTGRVLNIPRPVCITFLSEA